MKFPGVTLSLPQTPNSRKRLGPSVNTQAGPSVLGVRMLEGAATLTGANGAPNEAPARGRKRHCEAGAREHSPAPLGSTLTGAALGGGPTELLLEASMSPEDQFGQLLGGVGPNSQWLVPGTATSDLVTRTGMDAPATTSDQQHQQGGAKKQPYVR